MAGIYRDYKVGIFQIHFHKPVLLLQEVLQCNDALHLEVFYLYSIVQLFQVDDWPHLAILLGHRKEILIKTSLVIWCWDYSSLLQQWLEFLTWTACSGGNTGFAGCVFWLGGKTMVTLNPLTACNTQGSFVSTFQVRPGVYKLTQPSYKPLLSLQQYRVDNWLI